MTSQEQELLTRVARAIRDKIDRHMDTEDMARAAIEAMMEPPNIVGCLGVRVSSHDDEVLEVHLDHEAEGIDVVRLVHILETHDRASLSKGEK